MTGTDLEIIDDAHHGDIVVQTVRTSASTDLELLEVWLKSHLDGSAHTRIMYKRVGARFLDLLAQERTDLRRATINDVQAALEAMRVLPDGTAASAATINAYVAAVKSLLGFAHKVGFTRFNASPLIKIKKAPRQLAQRILSELDVQLLRDARTERDRVLLELAYYGGLWVSEISSLTWSQVIPRDSGEVQLALVGKSDKPRHVLLPAETATKLLAMRGDAPNSDRVFPISVRRIHAIVKATAKRAKINEGTSAHWLRHAHASHAIDNGAPITLVSQTLGHADLKTTSVYAHARPNESSSRYLKR
jgi:site-specific recombinase XerD